ncbi:MAG: hypothetical protein ABL986_08675 [Vicinamibacterales bacterium]
MSSDDQRAFEELDFRLRVLLPEEYQDTYESVQPVSMGSAGLKFDANGHVAWDEIWQTFCDLAMAGGPPHKGALLEQGTRADVEAQPERYGEVVAEICRGIVMATELPATESPDPGWVRVDCLSETMSAWLVRAIAMENVAVRLQGRALDLPASPRFRLEKEIKNVVTVIAKTSHYWLGHIPRDQKRAIADLFVTLNERTPLVEPAISDEGVRSAEESSLAASMADAIPRETGLVASGHQYAGWLGLQCADVRSAVWMMRALVASNVLARREGTVLYVPLNPDRASTGPTVVRTLAHVHGLLRCTPGPADPAY